MLTEIIIPKRIFIFVDSVNLATAAAVAMKRVEHAQYIELCKRRGDLMMSTNRGAIVAQFVEN